MRDRLNRTRQHPGHLPAAVAAAFLAAQSASAADEAATQPYHAALTDHVPGFITAPGQTDYLFVIVIVLILVMVLVIGNLYFQLHAVPERIAHQTNKVQMEIVAVLALISLFTHNHIYWILGLLLAFIRIPDFSTPLYSMARSLLRLSGRDPAKVDDDVPVASVPASSVPASGVPGATVPVANVPAGAVTAAPVTTAPVTAAPHASAPIAPMPAAAHPQPPGQTSAQPAQGATKTGPREGSI
jgi:hypothetical protein